MTGEPFEGTWREISRNKDIELDAANARAAHWEDQARRISIAYDQCEASLADANARIAELEKKLSLYSNLSAEYGLSMFPDISVAVTEAVAAEREACAKYRIGHDRYEKLRKLNPRQFGELWERHLKEDMRFDDMVDAL